MSDDSAHGRAMGTDQESFSGGTHCRLVVPDASRSQHVAFLKQSCGFSTQVRNGICCRKAIPTTKRYIGAFRLGAAMRFCGGCLGMLLTSFATEVRWMKKNASSTRRS